MRRQFNSYNSSAIIICTMLYLGSCGGSGTNAEKVFGTEAASYCDALNRSISNALDVHLTVDHNSLPRLYEQAIKVAIVLRPSVTNSAYTIDQSNRLRSRVFQGGKGTDESRLETCEDLATIQEIWNEMPVYSGLQNIDNVEQVSKAQAASWNLNPEEALIATALQSSAHDHASAQIFPIFMSAFFASMDFFSRYTIGSSPDQYDFGIRFRMDAEEAYTRKLPKTITVDSVRTMESSLQPNDEVSELFLDGSWRSVEGMKAQEFKRFFERSSTSTAKVKVFRTIPQGERKEYTVEILGTPNKAFGTNNPLVAGELVGNLIYVKLYEFSSGAAQQVADEISSLLIQWMAQSLSKQSSTMTRGQIAQNSQPAIMLDLRFNPGGSVDEALALLGLFLPFQRVGTFISRNQEQDVYPIASRIQFNNPLFVLVNHASASASELTAQVLQETGRAIIVGETTFGKGIGQSGFDLGIGSAIQGMAWITTLRFLGPSGKNIQLTGVVPDVEMTDKTLDQFKSEASKGCESITSENFKRCTLRMEDLYKLENGRSLVIEGRSRPGQGRVATNAIKTRFSELRNQVRNAERNAQSQGLGQAQGTALPDELRLVINRDDVTREISKVANQLLKP